MRGILAGMAMLGILFLGLGCALDNPDRSKESPKKSTKVESKAAWKQTAGLPCKDHGNQPDIEVVVRHDGSQRLYAACPDGTIWRRKP